jgi:hypothetical protein
LIQALTDGRGGDGVWVVTQVQQRRTQGFLRRQSRHDRSRLGRKFDWVQFLWGEDQPAGRWAGVPKIDPLVN